MKITDEAKGLLLEAIKANDVNCVLVNEVKSCCGSQLNFSLAKSIEGDVVEMIDGVPFMLDDAARVIAQKVTIQAENGQLFIHDENDNEGCC